MRPVLMAVLLTAPAVLSGPIEDLAVNTWYEVPNSHLNSVAPSGWSANVIAPWSSGAFDARRNNLIVWGGGHGDYSGNEIYVFNLDSLKWTRVNNPSNPPALDVPYAADGGPCSRHTYEYIDYVPNIDRFCSFGGAGFWQSGQTGTNNCDCFNFDTRAWERKAVMPNCGGIIGATSAWDAQTGNEWVHGTGTYSWPVHWRPAANAWIAHGKTWTMEELSYSTTMEIDPRKRKMVACGGGAFHVWDITRDTGTVLYTDPGSSGSGVNGAGNPGLAYDPVTEKIIGWSSGQTVYSLDLSTNTWTSQSASGANPGSPDLRGTYGRFRYCPKKNVFVVVNSISANVFIYRHTSASSAPQWYLDLIEPTTAAPAPAPARDNAVTLTISPNPFHAAAAITVNGETVAISVFDIHGRSVDRLASLDGRAFAWAAARHPAGVYLARAVVDGKVCQKRLIKMK